MILTIVRKISWFALIALLAACEQSNNSMSINIEQPEVQGESIVNDELIEFATRYATAWSSQDPVAFSLFYDANGSLTVNDGEPAVGRGGVEQKARDFMTAFPDMTVRLVELRQVGDQVQFHWRWTGTETGPGGSGNAVDLTGYEEWTFNDDGLIRQSLGHYDEADYERQISVPAG